jgi:hypothetical protein
LPDISALTRFLPPCARACVGGGGGGYLEDLNGNDDLIARVLEAFGIVHSNDLTIVVGALSCTNLPLSSIPIFLFDFPSPSLRRVSRCSACLSFARRRQFPAVNAIDPKMPTPPECPGCQISQVATNFQSKSRSERALLYMQKSCHHPGNIGQNFVKVLWLP